MLKIARIAIKKNAAFSDCIMVFGVKPYIVALNYMENNNVIVINLMGGPGSGKSTAASGIFYRLKKMGLARACKE